MVQDKKKKINKIKIKNTPAVIAHFDKQDSRTTS